jgi:hypothetical protein
VQFYPLDIIQFFIELNKLFLSFYERLMHLLIFLMYKSTSFYFIDETLNKALDFRDARFEA